MPEAAVGAAVKRLLTSAAKADIPKRSRELLYETVDVLEKKASANVTAGGWVPSVADTGPRLKTKRLPAGEYARQMAAAKGESKTRAQKGGKTALGKKAKAKRTILGMQEEGGSTQGKLLGKKSKNG